MSSSTSNSKLMRLTVQAPGKAALLFVLSLLLGTEISLRFAEEHLSTDVRHIRSAVITAEQLSVPQEQTEPKRILFLGNSSIRRGVDQKTLERRLEEDFGIHAKCWFFYPDGGNSTAWRWGWRKYFMEPQCNPDLILICGGNSHFDDGLIDVKAAASYFVSWGDSWDFSSNLRSSEEWLEFWLAKISVAYASRGRVQRRLMDWIIPKNRDALEEMVDVSSRQTGDITSANNRSRSSSETLAALLKDVSEKGVPVAVVAVPNLDSYEVSSTQMRVIESSGSAFWDFRDLEGIEKKHFFDRAHLDSGGAQILTIALAEQIGHLLNGQRRSENRR